MCRGRTFVITLRKGGVGKTTSTSCNERRP
jgi:septum formation inhibitor-activating ATPase MinD